MWNKCQPAFYQLSGASKERHSNSSYGTTNDLLVYSKRGSRFRPQERLRLTSHCEKTALKAATVASGAPIPLYRPLGPSAATVCRTASMAPEYLGG